MADHTAQPEHSMDLSSPRGREVLIAVAEVTLVIFPLILAHIVARFLEFIYLGPIAIVICVVVATGLLHRRDRLWSDTGLKRPSHWGKTLLGAVATFAAIVVASLILQGVTQVLELPPPDIEPLLVVRNDWFTLAMFLFPLSWGTAAFGEEMVTRGFILHRLADALGATRSSWILGILVQALIFGLAHSWQGLTGVLNVTVLGLILGSACYFFRGNLWASILAHGTLDFVTILAIATSS